MARPLSLLICLISLSSMMVLAERRALGREVVPFSRHQIENAAIWNFDFQNTLDERSPAYVRRANNIIYENADGVCRAYLLCADTVVYRGYNRGRREYMLVDSAAPAYRLPEGYTSSYTSHGLLDHDVMLTANGLVGCSVYGPGCMIAGGDTLRHIYVVAERHIEHRVFADSMPAEPDSMSIYKWISESSPLPLAIQYRRGGQSHLYVGDISAIDYDTDDDGVVGSETDDMIARTLDRATVSVSNGTFTVDFGSGMADAAVDVYLVDLYGYAFVHETAMLHAGSDARFTYRIPGGLSGQHIVALTFHDHPQLTRKIYVNL